MKFRIELLFLTLSFVFTACGTNEPKQDTNTFALQKNLVSESDYYTLIEKHTQNTKVYDGFTNLLDISATLLSRDAQLAQVDHNARIYQYTDSQYQNEKGTAQSNVSKQTEIFLSFYVPEKKYDDLARKSSKWKIFLDVAGQRYEPKIIRLKGALAEIQSLYPNHSRWGTAYKLIFPISTSIVESGSPKLTLTGPLTSSSVEFSN